MIFLLIIRFISVNNGFALAMSEKHGNTFTRLELGGGNNSLETNSQVVKHYGSDQ